MEPNRPRFKYELVVVIALLMVTGVVWILRVARNPLRPIPQPQVTRQSLPPNSVLELPPTAPLPTFPHPIFTESIPRESPSSTPEENVVKKAAPSQKTEMPAREKVPSRWEIVNKYAQEIELDFKYLHIAVDSDRFGYKGQAILYYQKYLSISPNGAYARQVRQRLTQLGSPH